MPPVNNVNLRDVIEEHKKNNEEVVQFRKQTLEDIKRILKDKDVQENMHSKRFRENLAESLSKNAPSIDKRSGIFIQKMLDKNVTKDVKPKDQTSLKKMFTDMVGKFYNTKMGKIYQGFAETIGGKMKEMFGNVMGHVKEVLGPVADAFSAVKDFMVGIGGFFKKTFSTLFGSKQEKMDKKRNSILQKIHNYFTRKEKTDMRDIPGKKKSKGILMAIGLIAGVILFTITGYIKDLFKGISFILKSIGIGKFVENLKILKGGKFLTPIFNFVKRFKDLGKLKFTEILNKVLDPLKTFGKTLGEIPVVKKILPVLKFIKEFIGIGFKIGKFLGVILGKLLLPLEMVFKGIKGFITGKGLMDKILSMSAGILDPLTTFFIELPFNLISWMFGSSKRIKFGSEEIKKIIVFYREWFYNNFFEPMMDFFFITLPNVFKTIPDYIRKLGEFIMGFPTNIGTYFTNMKTKAIEYFTAFQNYISTHSPMDALKDLFDFLKELPDKILEWINNMPLVKAFKGGWKGIKDIFFGDKDPGKEEKEPIKERLKNQHGDLINGKYINKNGKWLKAKKSTASEAMNIEDRKVQVSKKKAIEKSVTKKIDAEDLKKFRNERKRTESDKMNNLQNIIVSASQTSSSSEAQPIPDSTDNYMLGLAVAGLA